MSHLSSATIWTGVLCNEYPGIVWDADADVLSKDYVWPDELMRNDLEKVNVFTLYDNNNMIGVGVEFLCIVSGEPMKLANDTLTNVMRHAFEESANVRAILESYGFDMSTFGTYISCANEW